ncbi:hypothetical protein [Mycolicibacterium brumae]|uniref:Lactococcin 972 family bacteriocin n=1 Tax=Mycolicibacterium brumae TaxID=85968 RepID=A0A2G5PH51_9MYCO|nr:hypothetical protein [Mycolicibacterium brumae]MCV7192334.1 hypothetical protein [Mycolicibacterium brumae]PIB77636.1 hypothetical protein CQY22_001445 [Mycolicibacterium brumae]RWA18670.1 hypothetical protein MBRU_05510 [Mycolicibacterium brumae DSM 44177]UWW10103.1 hypothetical protein L2Z93_003223 [Mycolicibacterium brumae]
MKTRITRLVTGAVAALAAGPAMLLGAGVAHANALTLYPVPHVGGIWVGWDGGSGGTWCTYTSDWYTNRVYQNNIGQGGIFIPGIPLNRTWDIHVNCDNGDSGFLGSYYY